MNKILDILKNEQEYFGLNYNDLKSICRDIEYFANNGIEYILISQTPIKKDYTIILNRDDNIIMKLVDYYKDSPNNIKIECFYDKLKDKSKLSGDIILQSIDLFINNEEKYVYYCKLGEQLNLSVALYHLGLHYEKKGDFVKMIEYFNKSIERGNYNAAVDLGNCYKQNKDTENMLKYYLMADEKNIPKVKIELARYYKSQNDEEKMLKYLLECNIDRLTSEELLFVVKSFPETDQKRYDYHRRLALLKNIDSVYIMVNYYKTKNDMNNAEKMYLIAIDLGDTKSLHELIDLRIKNGTLNKSDPINIKAAESGYGPALYHLAYIIYTNYRNNGHRNDLDRMEKYFMMAIEKGNPNAMNHLCDYYLTLKPKNYDAYYRLCLNHIDKMDKGLFIRIMEEFLNDKGGKDIPASCIEILQEIDLTGLAVPTSIRILKKLITEQLDLMDMHFKYAPTSEGYEKAKQDFIKNLQGSS